MESKKPSYINFSYTFFSQFASFTNVMSGLLCVFMFKINSHLAYHLFLWEVLVISFSCYVERKISYFTFYNMLLSLWLIFSLFGENIHTHHSLISSLISFVFIFLSIAFAIFYRNTEEKDFFVIIVFILLSFSMNIISDLEYIEVFLRVFLFTLTYFVEVYIINMLNYDLNHIHLFIICFPNLHVDIYFLVYNLIVVLSHFKYIEKVFENNKNQNQISIQNKEDVDVIKPQEFIKTKSSHKERLLIAI